MSILEKVAALQLPSSDYVVIGSGLLDAWDLRESSDVDLVVSPGLFDKLAEDPKYKVGDKGSARFLKYDDYEIFDNWGEREEDTFASIFRQSVVVDGVRFVSPSYLIAKKVARGWKKDLKDVELLRERLNQDEQY